MLDWLLHAQRVATFDELPYLVGESARAAGFRAAVIYLVDVQQRWLVPMPAGGADEQERGNEQHPPTLEVHDTLAGRAYRESTHRETVVDGRRRLWLALTNNAERVGVLRLDGGTDDACDASAESLAVLTTLLVVGKRPHSDTFDRLTRTREMTLSAEVQWALLPPSTFASGSVVISGAIEPAYEVGGDAFDYDVTGRLAHLAVFDAMGHDLSSGLAATIAVQSWRNSRHAAGPGGIDLSDAAAAIDQALAAQFGRSRYVTGVLAELDTPTGQLRWISRGHPPPLLVRGQGQPEWLSCPPGPPMGLSLSDTSVRCERRLEPDERVVFLTDGMTDARDPQGEFFGEQRFVEFVTRQHAAQLSVPETLRRLLHALLAHQGGRLGDDATIAVLEW